VLIGYGLRLFILNRRAADVVAELGGET
jgi:hypothetical protein